ncbi:coiled-coil domain-containing protein 137 isoform X2 [Achroia grisella]|uniref:coiled-coil domain-containing protein 137 isoform X2 n=1 Tax=Achroia grisella TaxID=688607 RepID=UPI0027D24F72|nr:coiled-coil domain-containing protein 137 isoform X2 [Achroia grisella]
MGRKIPAKKHRGVKDPLEQNARRLQALKTKINAPPKDPDEQPVPRSLIDLFAFRDKHNTRINNKKKQKPRASDDGNKKIMAKNPISQLRKLPGESGRDFSLRINGAIRALHDATQPQHYPQDLEEDDIKGERMAEHRDRRERKRKRALAARPPPGPDSPPPLSRAQRFALKKKEKKLRALNAAHEDSPVYESVPFGECCQAPPTLTAARRAAPRPGRRDLLLNELLPANPAATGPQQRQRHVPPADRMRRERARLDAVAAYRAIKLNTKTNK